MAGNQDKAPETQAGNMDGILDTASSLGRTKTSSDPTASGAGQRSELDDVFASSRSSTRRRLGEVETGKPQATGTSMETLAPSGGGRMRFGQTDGAPASGMDDLFGASRTGTKVRTGSGSGGSSMDDFFATKKK